MSDNNKDCTICEDSPISEESTEGLCKDCQDSLDSYVDNENDIEESSDGQLYNL